jgi:hypothetical protein
MTDSGVRQMLERRCKDAGLDPIHPHRRMALGDQL